MAKYSPSLTAIDRDLAFSKKLVWLYVSLPSQPYEFIDAAKREGLAQRIEQGLQGLVQSGNKSVESFLIVTSVPFQDEEWIDELNTRTARHDPSPYWAKFSDNMYNHVHNRVFRTKEVFLSILVGKRSDYNSNKTFGPLGGILDYASQAVGVKDPSIPEKELEYWHNRAQEIRRNLRYGSLKAEEVRSNTIARLTKESLWPGMNVPAVSNSDKQSWGRGEISGIAIADVSNHKKFLRIEQIDDQGRRRVGYRATLCFSRFPDSLHFPQQEPWIHFASVLEAPATVYSRFTIVPAQKVSKDVDRKEKDALDQIRNSGDKVTIAMEEQLVMAQEVKYRLSRNRTPWIYGRHRIVLSAPTEEILYNRVQGTIDHYKDLDIDVIWSSGDQVKLLLESQPADDVRVSAYFQRQELGIIPIGMPTASGGAGDTVKIDSSTGKKKGWLGPYVGYSTSRVEEPSFVSLHAAISKNHPPGCVVIGSPGGGKSFFAFTMTYLMALQGTWVVYIDPKGDALPIADLPGLEGRVKKFDLKYGNDGLLDPFTLSQDKAEQQLLALETCKLFLGDNMTAGQEGALMSAVRKIAMQALPNLNKVVDELLSQSGEGYTLGGNLDLIRQLPFARLCFSNNTSADRMLFRADDGLTLISLQSLDLPATSDRRTYSTKNHLAVGIMYLLAHYTESLMNASDKSHPKAVVIDEAWAITSTPQGANMIPRLTRMGRSLNTAVILVSQNAGDFLTLTNNVSYRMAFRTQDKDEIRNVLKFYDLDPEDQGNIATMHGLENGECLMKDPDGNIARVKIDAWNDEMKYAFDTNPETRGKKQAA